jgi:predicted dehydrogenase
MAQKVRYAVVGLGHISQVAVLPAFAHAENSELCALVSSDPVKLRELGERHEVDRRLSYDGYDALLDNKEVDAVYIALPNHLHADYAIRAAERGVHVLCEKPMAVTEEECWSMIGAAQQGRVKLMLAYRLHFEEANMRAVEEARSGRLGDVRLFSSVFTMDVREGDIRLQAATGGGTLYDIGIYCINAARYLFQAEPCEVLARTESRQGDARFDEVDEMASVMLRFPGERIASFVTSFGTKSTDSYQVMGTKGWLRMEPCYGYTSALGFDITTNGGTERREFEARDQFAPQLVHFSDCILHDQDPEPDGYEGLADVRIIEAAYRSAAEGRPIRMGPFPPQRRPTLAQEMQRPPVEPEPEQVRAQGPRAG